MSKTEPRCGGLAQNGRPSLADPERLRALALPLAEAAAAAGAAILAVAARARANPITKGDGSPVTEADMASHHLLMQRLAALTPGVPIQSEEGSTGGSIDRGQPYWLVDPLDGTRDFLEGSEGWCVAVGLLVGGRPVLGTLAAPAIDGLWVGGPDVPPVRVTSAGTVPIKSRQAGAGGLAIVTSRRHSDQSRFGQMLGGQKVESILHRSSATKFALVAEGRVDVYVASGRTFGWDTAGGEALVVGAGGRMVDRHGHCLGYDRPDWVNPPFLAWGA